MNIRTLNENLLALDFVSDYKSFLWRECYDAAGDVEVYVPATSNNLSMYRRASFITIMDSKRLMLIEHIDTKRSLTSGKWIIVKGRSAEALFEYRTLLKDYSTDDNLPKPDNNLKVKLLFEQIFNENVALDEVTVQNMANDDQIPEVWRDEDSLRKRRFIRNVNGVPHDLIRLGSTDALIPPDDDPFEEDFKMTCSKGDNLYDVFTSYIQSKHIGMRLVWEERNNVEALYLDFYKGVDHTSIDDGDPLSIVIFSNEWDNINDMSFSEDTERYKNVAYADQSLEDAILYSRNEVEPTGVFRKEVRIDLSSENIPQDFTDQMPQIYKQYTIKKLNKEYYKKIKSDGEIDPYGFYQYKLHYNLGDLVEFRDEYGYSGIVRVTEYMYASDSAGEKSYPSFAIDEET